MRAGHFAAIPVDNEKLDTADPDVAGHSEVEDAILVVQREVETILAECAAGLGVLVQREVEATGVEPFTDDVTIHTDTGDIRARYVVGCGGGRSLVRRVMGFDFPGTDPERPL